MDTMEAGKIRIGDYVIPTCSGCSFAPGGDHFNEDINCYKYLRNQKWKVKKKQGNIVWINTIGSLYVGARKEGIFECACPAVCLIPSEEDSGMVTVAIRIDPNVYKEYLSIRDERYHESDNEMFKDLLCIKEKTESEGDFKGRYIEVGD